MVGVFSSLIRLWGAFLSIMRLIWGAFSSFIRFGGSSSAASCSDVASDGSCSDVASDGSCSSSYDDDINQTQKYHVFLSFRGPDNRKKFTSHLHRALCDKGIETYIDNRLESGDQISPALLKAIEWSKIAVIIFSENYASSAWCLDELLHIVNCNLIVIPIFYGVDPSHIRRHKGTFGKKLQQRFKPDKLNAWREAMKKVANISGYHSDSEKYESEADLVKKIVHDISKKLDSMSVCDDFHLPNLVGISEHIAHIQSQLAIGSQDVRIIGIWGIGGIGKTTIAQTLYDRFKSQFEGKCFLPNIRETLKNQGEGYLQKKLFSKLLKEKNPKLVQNRLRSMKVLLVLDDVDNSNIQPRLFETLKQGWFGLESRIIVTTRNKQVLQNIGADNFYGVSLLDLKKGCELFQLIAFRNKTPSVEYVVLIERFVDYAGGLPLALKVLAYSLCNKSAKDWKSALVKLQKFPNRDINAVLRWSFDGLDQQEKDIFLDIACFFKGKPKKFVARILEACDSCGADIGISVLNDKSLIYINASNEVEMHDLVQQMGWNIAQESIEEPGKRKRIFMADDVEHILAENTVTPSIRGIALNTYYIKDVVELKATCFSNMPNLKFLRIYDSSHCLKIDNKLNLPEGLNGLPRGLRYLEWKGYNYKYLPSELYLRNLVELIMPYSLLQRLWIGALPLDRLKKINLEYSTHLIEFPDISRAPELEVINLKGCKRLFSTFFVKEISDIGSHIKELNLSGCKSIETMPFSIECLRSLVKLDMSYCWRLKSIPASICKLKSLKELSLLNCLELEKFVEILEPMEHLRMLDLRETSIIELGSSIQNLVGLEKLYLCKCKKLRFLPASICKLKSLVVLNLRYCIELEKFVEILEPMEHLWTLDLSETSIKELGTSIQNLVGLKRLYLSECMKLQFLPASICKLKYLEQLCLRNCIELEKFVEILEPMEHLWKLDLSGTSIKELDTSIQNLVCLEKLYLCKCKKLQFLPASICKLKSLMVLNLGYCLELEKFVEILEHMEHLRMLDLSETSIKELGTSIQNLVCLEILELSKCKKLQFLPASICKLKSLKELCLQNCIELEKFVEILEPMEHLWTLDLSGTSIKKLGTSIQNLVGLNILDLSECKKLLFLPASICKLKYLEELHLQNCIELEKFVEILEPMEHLWKLDLSGTSIKELDTSIQNLVCLEILDLSKCKKLQFLPASICKLKSLKELHLWNCVELEKFVEILEPMEYLRMLDLSGTSIKEFGSSIQNLVGLEKLYLCKCKKLQFLPTSICKLKSLVVLNLRYCIELEKFVEILEPMEHLWTLDLSGTSIKELGTSIQNLVGLKRLYLSECKKLQFLPASICKLKYLEQLCLRNCIELEKFVEISEPMEHLWTLDLSGTSIKKLGISIQNLFGLKHLSEASISSSLFG